MTMLVLIWANLIFSVWSDDANSTDLSWKPSLMIPPLTVGQESTLNCTAPSLCSESDPAFTWMWRGAGEDNFVPINSTTNQGQHSTWTFNPSAEHHRGEVTCVVNCTGDDNTTETLNVTYVKTPEITGVSTVKEGDVLNLTCTVDSFPPSVITWTKQNKSLTEKSESDPREDTGTSTLIIYNVTAGDSGQYFCTANHLINHTQHINITVLNAEKLEITGETAVTEGVVLNLTCSVDTSPPPVITWTRLGYNTTLENGTGTATVVISNVTASQSGQYICTAKHLNYTLTEEVNVTVKAKDVTEDVMELRITGSTTIKEGDALNLTCTAGKEALSTITWSKVGSDSKLPNQPSATLLIPNMTAEYGGPYICTAKYQNTTLSAHTNITVNVRPKILNESVCELQSDVLTCVCVSEGIPLPTIKWPLLENHTQYSVVTSVSKQTVNSTVILTVKDNNNTAVECVSSNENGDVKKHLNEVKVKGDGDNRKLIKVITRLEMIVAFLIGTLFSAFVFCLARICCRRKKQRTYGNLAETLEMVTSQEDPLMNAGEAREDAEVEDQETAEGAETDVPEKSDVEYSKINFSLMKRKSPAEAGTSQGATETEYAEIKKGGAQGGAAGEGKEDEEVKSEEIKHCNAEEEEGEDAALYSSVSDILGQI